MYFHGIRRWGWNSQKAVELTPALMCVCLSGYSPGEVWYFKTFAGRLPACFSRSQREHTHTAASPFPRASMVFHITCPPQRKDFPKVLTPKQPNLSQHLEMHHSGSVTLTSSGWKNATSLANLVPFLDRSGNGGGMKKIQRTIFFISIWTLREPETSLGAVIPPNPQVNLGGNFWVIIISDKPTRSACFLQFKFVL